MLLSGFYFILSTDGGLTEDTLWDDLLDKLVYAILHEVLQGKD